MSIPAIFQHIFAAGDLRRIGLRAEQHEVVVHHVLALHGVALRQELLLQRLGVHQDHVGIAAPADVERLSGADRDDAHFDPGRGGEDRQQVTEQPRLFRGGGRGDGDEAGDRGGERYTQGNSPFMNAAASAVAGRAKNWSIGARSITRPACR
jgi:hypothetical protein